VDRRLRILAESDDPGLAATLAVLDKLEKIEHRVEAPRKKNGNGGVYVPRWVLLIAGPLLTVFLIWLTTSVVGMNTRVAVIEGNRFTASDAQTLRRSIETGIPPDDVLRRLESHENRLTRIENGGT